MGTRLNASLLWHELTFTTSRSSGPGGQNVNKVNTKVILKWDLENSLILNEEEKVILKEKLAAKITSDGSIVLMSQHHRSQNQNKESVIEKFNKLIGKAFEKRKKRKPSKPSKASKEERLKGKKQLAEKKRWRQKPV